MASETALLAPNSWLDRSIRVWLIGAGGNGSEVADVLCMFHTALLARGHEGLNVTIWDDSDVREPNIVRQRFWPCDIGMNKAVVLANRYNMLLGTQWTCIPELWAPTDIETTDYDTEPDIVITAVDLPSVRLALSKSKPNKQCIWLDLGNQKHHGQAVLGVLSKGKKSRYPHVVDHYPEIAQMKDDPAKSCSASESLTQQGMLTNRAIVTAGMPLLWELISEGKTRKNCAYIDLQTGQMQTERFT